MGTAAEARDLSLLDAFARPAGRSGWAMEAVKAAEDRFASMGAPGRRDEYWRFTNPARFTAVPAEAAASGSEAQVFDGVDAVKLVFVDGVLDAAASDALALDNVEIGTLDAAMGADIHWAKGLFGTLEAASQDRVARPLAALNTARAEAGLTIKVSGAAEKPIHLSYLHSDPKSDAMVRVLVQVEAGASLTLLESGAGAARFNTVVEADVAKGAAFHHVRAQGRDHERATATAMFTQLAEEATFKSFTLTMNGVMTRNENIIDFTGDNAVAHVAGACVGDGTFHHDDTVYITHDGVDCESRQVFKKVLKNGAVGVFQGKILVQPDAQKTDGYQISQGLLLDEDSQFLAKPELEIYADDVACSHGSTCGSVDEDQLFYLTSRGISRGAAEDLLVLSFMAEAIEEIEDEDLRALLVETLEGWLSRHG